MSFGYRDKFKAAREEALDLEDAAPVEDPEDPEDTEDRRPLQTTTAPVADFTADVTPPSYPEHLEATAKGLEGEDATDSTGEETPA